MCGIAGIKAREHSSALSEAVLLEMRDVLSYRGPDDAGCWLSHNDQIGLAHRRLSILDPTLNGHQPMHDVDTGNSIVFNGEIYNYIEIREELIKLGHTFVTGTDTEVILKAYAEFGKKGIELFNGMFAIAIWNSEKKELFLARDRLGIKPLYYYCDNDALYFSSEPKSLRAVCRNLPVRIELIDQYMHFGYVPGPNTLDQGVFKLPPGHYATYKDNYLKIEKYWDVAFDNKVDLGIEYYREEGKKLLENAISLRLRSDVPLGIFLSGGIDSSAIVGLMASKVNAPLKTFSVAFNFGQEFNETNYARMIAKQFGTDHHELIVTPEDYSSFIPKFSELMGEPVADAACISLQLLSQLTSKHVTVVLSGEGSDEIFGGYDWYQYMLYVDQYRKMLPQKMRHVIGHSSHALMRMLGKNQHKLIKYINMSTDRSDALYQGNSHYGNRRREGLYRKDFLAKLKSDYNGQAEQHIHQLFSSSENLDTLSRMLSFDLKTWLVDDLLVKADRMSMGSSLELRVPFLDYRLVEFAARMPSKYKIHKGEGKYIFKKMMEGVLPNEIIYRKKMGFPTPLKLMFEGALGEYAHDVLLSGNASIHDYFNERYIQNLLQEHRERKCDHHRILWQLLVLEEWFIQRSVQN